MPNPQPSVDLSALAVNPSQPWSEQPIAAIDLETTGPNATTCHIVTASILLIHPDGSVITQWEWLADPAVEIPESATAVHGISTEYARQHGTPSREVTSEIIETFRALEHHSIAFLAFNAAYDFTVVSCQAQRHGLTCPVPNQIVDPYVIHKHVRRRWRGKRTLVALADSYGVSLESAHTSAADALAAVALAHTLAEQHPELRVPAAELHTHQIQWSQDQAQDLQRYLRDTKNDPTITIDGRWPLRP